MKRLVLIISLLFLSSNFLLAQDFGGVRHLRTQGVAGFQNGIGLDIEYVIPVLSERIAVRTGFGVLPVSLGSLELEGLNGELDLTGNTFDVGLKFYFSGRSHGMFLGVDIGFDNKNIEYSDVFGKTTILKNIGGGDAGEVEVNDGELEVKTSGMMITPKIGMTKVSSKGFTWSLEIGYSIINTNPTTAIFTDEAIDGTKNRYEYTFDNIYKDLFNMGGLPYARIGFGYSFKISKQTY